MHFKLMGMSAPRYALLIVIVILTSAACLPFKKSKGRGADDLGKPVQTAPPTEPVAPADVVKRQAEDRPIQFGTAEMQSAQVTLGITPFLKATDLQPQNKVDVVEANALAALLSNDYFLYASRPESKAGDGEASHCDEQRNVKVHATKTTMTIFYDFDAADCTNLDDHTEAYTSSRQQLLAQVTCQDRDLTEFNGKSALDLSEPITCAAKSLFLEFRMVSTYKARNGVMYTSSSIRYLGNPAMGPCVANKQGSNLLYDDSCMEVAITDSTIDGKHDATTYAKLTYHGLTESYDKHDAVWYTGGQINLDYDYWSGVVTYSDATTAPTFSMSAPSKGTVTGSLTTVPED